MIALICFVGIILLTVRTAFIAFNFGRSRAEAEYLKEIEDQRETIRQLRMLNRQYQKDEER